MLPLVRNHPLDLLQVRFIHHDVLVEVAFALGVLRRQDVTRKRVSAFHLPRRSFLEALGGAGMGLQLRHSSRFYNRFLALVSRASFPTDGNKSVPTKSRNEKPETSNALCFFRCQDGVKGVALLPRPELNDRSEERRVG